MEREEKLEVKSEAAMAPAVGQCRVLTDADVESLWGGIEPMRTRRAPVGHYGTFLAFTPRLGWRGGTFLAFAPRLGWARRHIFGLHPWPARSTRDIRSATSPAASATRNGRTARPDSA